MTAHISANSIKPCLYYAPTDNSSQKVLLLGRLLNIPLKTEVVNCDGMDHYSDTFRSKSIQSTIPILKNTATNLVLCEMPAILTYLTATYADDHNNLYPPGDIFNLARINQILEYDYNLLQPMVDHIYFDTVKYFEEADESKSHELDHAIFWINNQLKGQKFIATSYFSLADLVLVVTISQVKAFGYNTTRYTRLNEWHDRCKQLLYRSNFREIVDDNVKEVAERYWQQKSKMLNANF